MSATALAVDLGSSSGRIIAGTLRDGRIEEVEVHRFLHTAAMTDGYLCWDLDLIWREVRVGLERAVERFPDASSVSVDTWGVDYVPLDAADQPVTPGRSYRDERTTRTLEQFRHRLPDDEAWRLTGIAPATINSANQMFAFLQEEPEAAARTRQVLFLPDYFTWLLSGAKRWSRSIASTAGLCSPGALQWSREVFDSTGIPREWVGDLTMEHDAVGGCSVPGLEQLTVVRAGAHDSACAVHALLREPGQDTYFLSSGSWSVLGVVRDEPLMSADAHRLGLTNEARADAGVRPLYNITGLWILQECQRQWAAAGEESDIIHLVRAAEQAPSPGVTFDPDEPQFALPGDMVGRVTDALHAGGAHGPFDQGIVVRAILESLAARYARGMAGLSELTGTPARRLSVVGGGSRNQLLCDLTAQAVGIPVTSGPAEASTLGSLIAQFEIMGTLDSASRNDVITATAHTRTHRP